MIAKTIERSALREVNRVRRRAGAKPLLGLPMGVQGDPHHCPIANAFGDINEHTFQNTLFGGNGFPSVTRTLFVVMFDLGKLPWLSAGRRRDLSIEERITVGKQLAYADDGPTFRGRIRERRARRLDARAKRLEERADLVREEMDFQRRLAEEEQRQPVVLAQIHAQAAERTRRAEAETRRCKELELAIEQERTLRAVSVAVDTELVREEVTK